MGGENVNERTSENIHKRYLPMNSTMLIPGLSTDDLEKQEKYKKILSNYFYHIFRNLKENSIGWRDTYIGAITMLNGKTIITSNKKHFERIPELKIIEYY